MSLRAQVTNFMSVCHPQDVTPLCSASAPACSKNLFDAPKGNNSDPPLLVSLLLSSCLVFPESSRGIAFFLTKNGPVDRFSGLTNNGQVDRFSGCAGRKLT